MSDLTVHTWITSAPPTIGPKESLRRARAVMRAAKVSELLVMDGSVLVGTLSERDIWEHCPTSVVVMDDKQAEELLDQIRVGGIMALHPPTITPDTSLREAAQIFAQSKRSGLPVLDDGALVGLLTEESVMRAVAMLLGEEELKIRTGERG